MGTRTRKPPRKSGWRQWKASEARQVVEAWRSSGLPLETFARERGLTGQRLRWWRDRLGEWSTGDARAPGLVPAIVTGTPGAGATVMVTVRVGEVVVEIADVAAVPASWLGALVSGLARPAA